MIELVKWKSKVKDGVLKDLMEKMKNGWLAHPPKEKKEEK